jgi:hypothetical protein
MAGLSHGMAGLMSRSEDRKTERKTIAHTSRAGIKYKCLSVSFSQFWLMYYGYSTISALT